jgi:hypothetical protein
LTVRASWEARGQHRNRIGINEAALAPSKRSKKSIPKAESQRHRDIRRLCKQRIDDLIHLYETTNPANGTSAEKNKLERARQAISIWWYLWADLMLWAQSHLAGYEMLKEHPELRERIEQQLGQELTVDSHAIEYVGVYFSWNHVNDLDPLLNKIHEIMGEEFEITMTDPPLRPIIRELLVSRSANSSFWRFPLQSALFALNLGQVNELVRPSEVRRQGNPVELYRWKLFALAHVQFLIGKGFKKYKALENVSIGIAQSVETLRSWEKAYSFDDDAMMRLQSARMAGSMETELDTRSLKELSDEYETEYHRHTSELEYAVMTLRELRETPLDKVREGLRIARTGKVVAE